MFLVRKERTMVSWRHGIVVVWALVLSGCFMAELRPCAPIPVPPNLSDEDAEVVILFALAQQPLPKEFTQGERIADQALQAFLGWRYQSAQVQGVWFPEAVEPGLITAGYTRGQFYLRVAMRIQQHGIDLRVLDSRNLNQQGTQIHEAALAWLDDLETGTRRALGQAAALRRLGMERR